MRRAGARRFLGAPRALAFAVTASLLLAGCGKKEEDVKPVVSVQAEPAAQGTIHDTVSAQAVLFPLNQAAIVPKIVAPVTKFYVNRGSRVKKGDLLAELENRDLSAAEMESRGLYDQAEASYKLSTAMSLPEEFQKAEFDFEVAKKSLEAEQKVYDSRKALYEQGALPRKDFDQAGIALSQARSQYDIAERHLKALHEFGKTEELRSAEAQRGAAKGHFLGAQAQVSYSQIRSPIDGVITDRPLYPGETAAPGTAILTVMDTSQVIAKAHIAQDEAARIKVGRAATITAPGDDKPVEGKVTLVSPALDANSTTLEVWVQAKNPEGHLKPGTTVSVSIVAETVPNAIVIPASALLTSAEGATTVMLFGDDGLAHSQAVKAGIHEGDKVQILEGLKAGAKVITVGAYGLDDKTKVQIAEAAKEGEGKDEKKADQKDDKKDN
jgi:multidrug efflux pump subunit AcrA (membrane-fusion protein)